MMGIEWLRPAAFFGSILYALIGVLVLWFSFLLIDKLTPYDLWAEIVVAGLCIAIGLIVSAAIHS
jgi:putative membrane protein